MSNQKIHAEKKGGINPIVAAVTVAVVGAGIAGAIVLKDKKNRDKVKEKLTNVKNRVGELVDNKKKEAQNLAGKAKKR